MVNKKNKNEPVIYIPDNADLNSGCQSNNPPKTKYENRKFVLRKEEVEKLTKGKYGSDAKDRRPH